MRRTSYVRVDVDVDEVLDDLSDKELLEYCKERGLKDVQIFDKKALFHQLNEALEEFGDSIPWRLRVFREDLRDALEIERKPLKLKGEIAKLKAA